MAKDYFEDITPPSPQGDGRRAVPISQKPYRIDDTSEETVEHIEDEAPQPRGIRSISAPARRPYPPRDTREAVLSPRTARERPRWLMWVAAALAVIVVAGLGLFAFRSTTVTVIPKSQIVVFGQTSQFTAYPASTAASGTLSYTVQSVSLDDSQVVAAQGTTTTAASKASGNITVYNNYSTSPVPLIKNTRFATPEGLIFRTPANIVVPGKKGSTPGQVTITVVADVTGEQYNVGPVAHFTLPGLQTSAMYTSVYAVSTSGMTGGASAGSGPSIAPADLAAAVTQLRSGLATKVRDAVQALSTGPSVAFADMDQISYQDLPQTTEAGGGVRVHESAQVNAAIFPADLFAQTVAAQVSADAEGAPIKLLPQQGFAVQLISSNANFGTDPLTFGLAGQAELVWNVDSGALAAALAGHDSGAFETIVNTFPGIQEAHARIEPFWKTTFPNDPNSIKVTIEAPAPAAK